MKRDDAAQMSHLTMTSQAVPEPSAELLRLATGVRRAAIDLGQTTDQQRQQALETMAAALERHREQIAAANAADLEQAAADGLAPLHADAPLAVGTQQAPPQVPPQALPQQADRSSGGGRAALLANEVGSTV